MSDAVTRTVLITNKRGLHARASAKFVTLASTQPVEIRVSKDDGAVTGTSIMGLMMLGAAKGDSITISASGDGAEAAVGAAEAGAAIVHLHARNPETGEPDQTPEAFAKFLPVIKQRTNLRLHLEDRISVVGFHLCTWHVQGSTNGPWARPRQRVGGLCIGCGGNTKKHANIRIPHGVTDSLRKSIGIRYRTVHIYPTEQTPQKTGGGIGGAGPQLWNGSCVIHKPPQRVIRAGTTT